jgi:hypothetical protein
MTARGPARISERIAEIDELLSSPNSLLIRALIEGPKSMARLTYANLRAFVDCVDRLSDPEFAESLITDPHGSEHQAYVERLQHLAANYFLSAVPFLEQLERHVKANYPNEAHPTRVQHRLGLARSVKSYSGHVVVVQLRHMVAHRQLPTVRLVRSPHHEQSVAATVDRRELLADPKCRNPVRALLEGLPTDELSLDGLIRDHGDLVTEFADWFFRIQGLHHLAEILPIWKLQEERLRLVRELSR